MEQFDIYKDIAERTGGDIYMGVVGPVRTGKSTFIKRFMDLIVLPNIENAHTKERARDELPQSAAGKTIMTTEPKFVPNEAVEIALDDNSSFRVRLIDCVGYLVPGAEGHLDGETPRMVSTPWSQEQIPFAQAAEIGTKKVINDHSTIGIVVTTDGSVTDIAVENYKEAQTRVVRELKDLNKPFIVLLNTVHPYSTQTQEMALEMEQEYEVPVVAVNCAQLKVEDIKGIMERILYEFPVKEVRFSLPRWIETLENDHWLKSEIIATIRSVMGDLNKLQDVKGCIDTVGQGQYIKKAYVDTIALGEGLAEVEMSVEDTLFYKVLSETTGMPVENDFQLISMIKKMAEIKTEYDKIECALGDVRRKGYGIVSPLFEEIKLEKPESFKQGSRHGIRLKARGESIHMVRADIETEVSPIIGGEEQSKEFIENIMREYETDPQKIWDLNIFGRTLSSMVNEGMQNKIYRMPEDAQMKLQETLQKIVNEGSGGLICILL